jgi:hypothetical protein
MYNQQNNQYQQYVKTNMEISYESLQQAYDDFVIYVDVINPNKLRSRIVDGRICS